MHDSEDELLRAPYSLCACRIVLATLFTLAIYSINTRLNPSFFSLLQSSNSPPQAFSTTTTITTALTTQLLPPLLPFCLSAMAATGPANPVSAALAVLDAANLDLEHCSALQDVSASLVAIDLAVREHSPPSRPMRVYGKVVYYTNANSRISHFNLYLERNPEHAKQFTNEEWEEEMAAYGIVGEAVAQAVQTRFFVMMGTIQNPVFSHSFTAKVYGIDTLAARRQHYTRDVEWYEFVFLLDRQRVSSCSNSPS